jgi:hypothetical protein
MLPTMRPAWLFSSCVNGGSPELVGAGLAGDEVVAVLNVNVFLEFEDSLEGMQETYLSIC